MYAVEGRDSFPSKTTTTTLLQLSPLITPNVDQHSLITRTALYTCDTIHSQSLILRSLNQFLITKAEPSLMHCLHHSSQTCALTQIVISQLNNLPPPLVIIIINDNLLLIPFTTHLSLSGVIRNPPTCRLSAESELSDICSAALLPDPGRPCPCPCPWPLPLLSWPLWL